MVLGSSTKTSYERNKNILVYYYSNWLELAPFDCGQVNYWFFRFKRKVLSNKMGHNVGITSMEEVLVPWEYRIEVMGHMDPISYGK